KELRSLSRTPRFRVVFLMGCSFGLLVWLPFTLGRNAARHGQVAEHFLVIVCVYALTLLGQVSYCNSLGFDRSAAQMYFTAPQPFWRVLVGKNIAAAVFVYLEVFILTAATLLLRTVRGAGEVIEAIVVAGICSLYMLALGNVSSTRYPRALTPERVS